MRKSASHSHLKFVFLLLRKVRKIWRTERIGVLRRVKEGKDEWFSFMEQPVQLTTRLHLTSGPDWPIRCKFSMLGFFIKEKAIHYLTIWSIFSAGFLQIIVEVGGRQLVEV